MIPVLRNLTNLVMPSIKIFFGHPIRFSDGQGVYLTAQDDLHASKALRNLVLQDIIAHPRNHEPHITLIHPTK